MTVRTPPTFLQAGTHTAENTRLLAHGLLQSGPSAFAGGVAAADPAHGVARIGDLGVTANGTPNMSVNVAAGGCFIRGTQSASQGVYHVFNDATVNMAIDAADPTNPRRDLIVMQVRDSGYAGASDDARLFVVKGTAAASPADPSVPADSLVLARVTVDAAATTIVSGKITDLRTFAYGNSQIATFASTTERNTYLPTPVEGMLAYTNDTNTYWSHNGTGWETLISTGQWKSWTPTLIAAAGGTNPTLGTGAIQEGFYCEIGKLVIATAYIVFGTSGVNAGVGEYAMPLPIAPDTSTNRLHPTGTWYAQDSSAGNTLNAGQTMAGGTSFSSYGRLFYTSAYPFGGLTSPGANAPWTWAANDTIRALFIYRAA